MALKYLIDSLCYSQKNTGQKGLNVSYTSDSRGDHVMYNHFYFIFFHFTTVLTCPGDFTTLFAYTISTIRVNHLQLSKKGHEMSSGTELVLGHRPI